MSSRNKEYTTAPGKKVASGLRVKDVVSCTYHLYHTLSTRAHRHDGTIVIGAVDRSVGGDAALAAILKVQSHWPGPLAWSEDRKIEVKGNEACSLAALAFYIKFPGSTQTSPARIYDR